MTYIAIRRGTENDDSIRIDPGTPLHIKIPSRDSEDQPILGFATIELGEKFLERKNIPLNDYQIVPIEKGSTMKGKNQSVFIVESESQVDEMESDSEGYDYESHILQNAL